MSIEYQEPIGSQTRRGYTALAYLSALTVATFILMGCNKTKEASAESPAEPAVAEPTLAERGGGIAIFNNGELVEISPDGSVGNSCNVCNVAESDEKCESRAQQLGIPLCKELIKDAKDDYSQANKSERDALASSQRITNSIEIIRSARATSHDAKMCEVINKGKGLEKIPYDPSKCDSIDSIIFPNKPCFCWI